MLQEFRSQKITWDKANNNVYEKIEAHEGDSNGRKLIVQVLNDGIVEDLTGSTLSLAWQTKDRASFGLDAFASTDITKGQFEIYYPTGMLTKAGIIKASLVIVDSNGRLESKNFDIVVNKTNADDEAVQSDNSFTALTEALVTVNQYDARIAANTQGVADLDTRVSAHLADYTSYKEMNGILEQGGNVNGHYEKYANGRMDCWGNILVNACISEAWENMYRSSLIQRTFPATFIRLDKVNANIVARADSGKTIAFLIIEEASLTKFTYYLTRPRTTGSANYELHYHAIGRWR